MSPNFAIDVAAPLAAPSKLSAPQGAERTAFDSQLQQAATKPSKASDSSDCSQNNDSKEQPALTPAQAAKQPGREKTVRSANAVDEPIDASAEAAEITVGMPDSADVLSSGFVLIETVELDNDANPPTDAKVETTGDQVIVSPQVPPELITAMAQPQIAPSETPADGEIALEGTVVAESVTQLTQTEETPVEMAAVNSDVRSDIPIVRQLPATPVKTNSNDLAPAQSTQDPAVDTGSEQPIVITQVAAEQVGSSASIEESSEHSTESTKRSGKKSSKQDQQVDVEQVADVAANAVGLNVATSQTQTMGADVNTAKNLATRKKSGNVAASEVSTETTAPQATKSEIPDSSAAGVAPGRNATSTERSDRVAQSQTVAHPAEIDRNRFIQRVARAFQAADEQGGQIRLRLSPPELGVVKIELAIQDGVMSAQLETETTVARSLLVDNLPALKERLAEMNIKIEKFDVDVRSDSGGQTFQHASDRDAEKNGRQFRSDHGHRSAQGIAPQRLGRTRPGESTTLNVVI